MPQPPGSAPADSFDPFGKSTWKSRAVVSFKRGSCARSANGKSASGNLGHTRSLQARLRRMRTNHGRKFVEARKNTLKEAAFI